MKVDQHIKCQNKKHKWAAQRIMAGAVIFPGSLDGTAECLNYPIFQRRDGVTLFLINRQF